MHSSLETHLRGGACFDDLDAFRIGLGGEVLGGGPHLFSRRRFGERDHEIRIRLPRIGASPEAILEVLHLLDEILDVQPIDGCVLRASRSIGEMAETAGTHRLSATPNNLRQLPAAIFGIPIGNFLPRSQRPSCHGALCAGDADDDIVVVRQSGRRAWRIRRRRRSVRPVGQSRRHRRGRRLRVLPEDSRAIQEGCRKDKDKNSLSRVHHARMIECPRCVVKGSSDVSIWL